MKKIVMSFIGFLFLIILIGLFLLLAVHLFFYKEQAKNTKPSVSLSLVKNLNNIQPTDFIRYQNTWYPVRRIWKDDKGGVSQIGIGTRGFAPTILTRYDIIKIDSVISSPNTNDPWVEKAKSFINFEQ